MLCINRNRLLNHIKNGNIQAVDRIILNTLESNNNVTTFIEKCEKVIVTACQYDQIEIVRLMLGCLGDEYIPQMAYINACRYGHLDILKMLIQRLDEFDLEISVNPYVMQDIAQSNGHCNIVQYLDQYYFN